MNDEERQKVFGDELDEEAFRKRETKRRVLLACIIVICVILMAGVIYGAITQAPAAGEVTVTIEVRYDPDANSYAYFVHVPKGASLKDALLETGEISGRDTEDGFAVIDIRDIGVNTSKGEYWAITNHEEALGAKPEDFAINEDLHFELTFVKGE